MAIKTLLKSIDLYGHKIQLLYEGRNTYQTYIGGGCTALTIFLVLLNAALMLQAGGSEPTIKYL